MKQNLLYISVIFLLVSCISNNYKSELLGNWYFYDIPENSKHLNVFKIHSDSILINSIMGTTIEKWKATKKQILLYDLKGYPGDSELTNEYKLKSNDRLELKVYGDTIIEFKNIVKAQNAMDFLQKSINLKIDLPNADKELIEIGNSPFIFTIYAGYDNGRLKFLTDNYDNLSNLEKEITDFKEEFDPRPFSKANFILIADKNIPNKKLDSLKQILNQTLIKRIFRAYKNDTIKYKNNLIWYGLVD